MGKEFQRRAKATILRAAVLRNQVHVKVRAGAAPARGSSRAGTRTVPGLSSRVSTPVPSPRREPGGADAGQQPVPDEHQHVRAPVGLQDSLCAPPLGLGHAGSPLVVWRFWRCPPVQTPRRGIHIWLLGPPPPCCALWWGPWRRGLLLRALPGRRRLQDSPAPLPPAHPGGTDSQPPCSCVIWGCRQVQPQSIKGQPENTPPLSFLPAKRASEARVYGVRLWGWGSPPLVQAGRRLSQRAALL